MLCVLCEQKIKGQVHKTLVKAPDGKMTLASTCNRCWDKNYNIAEAIMAKKKAAKKPQAGRDSTGRHWPGVKPCSKCGRTDFENDFKRRGHQGHCAATPIKTAEPAGAPPKAEKVAKPKIKQSKGDEKAPVIAPPAGASLLTEADAEAESEDRGEEKRTPSQVGRGSRVKGAKFENWVKKTLASWWGEPEEVAGTKNSAFQRAPGSGGMSPKNWPLDLHTPTDFPWWVECKKREGDKGLTKMERFLSGEKYPVMEWFKEAERQLCMSGASRRPVLLVFTCNSSPVLAAIRRPAISSDELMPAEKFMVLSEPGLQILVMNLLNLLGMASPEGWQTVYKTYEISSFSPR